MAHAGEKALLQLKISDLPWMDGVGFVSQAPSTPGATFQYRFKASPCSRHPLVPLHLQSLVLDPPQRYMLLLTSIHTHKIIHILYINLITTTCTQNI